MEFGEDSHEVPFYEIISRVHVTSILTTVDISFDHLSHVLFVKFLYYKVTLFLILPFHTALFKRKTYVAW